MKQIRLIDALAAYEQITENMSLSLFGVALLASLLAAFLAAALYRIFYESRGTGSQVARAFPLLSLAITTLFVCIQVSIPLSLGLLGSLSIIRFRTPIKEPEEVGFIMLLIAASVSAATFNFLFMTLLMVVAVVALLLVRGARTWKMASRDGVLVLQLADADAAGAWPRLQEALKQHVGRLMVESSSSRDGQTSLHLVFSGLKTSAAELQAGLRAVVPVQTINLFLDRPGGLR